MKRREVEARLALYDDLAGILGAMRSFALAELHRLLRREEAQQDVVAALAQALADMAYALPPASAPMGDVWLLLGSVRGFCGSFNEDVARAWREAGGGDAPAVAVGERLAGLLPATGHVIFVPGALGGLDAPAAIDRILAGVNEARAQFGGKNGLIVCLRDKDGPRCQRLLPLPRPTEGNARLPPLTLEPALHVAARVAEQTLFHHLLALVLRSIRVENHMRLMQMENALGHLDRGREDLLRQRNRLRQEEIVEEIEVMVTRRDDRPAHAVGNRGHGAPD
jgi:F-type H+-transporting ATPase subunit gamma